MIHPGIAGRSWSETTPISHPMGSTDSRPVSALPSFIVFHGRLSVSLATRGIAATVPKPNVETSCALHTDNRPNKFSTQSEHPAADCRCYPIQSSATRPNSCESGYHKVQFIKDPSTTPRWFPAIYLARGGAAVVNRSCCGPLGRFRTLCSVALPGRIMVVAGRGWLPPFPPRSMGLLDPLLFLLAFAL